MAGELDLERAPMVELERAAAARVPADIHGYYATGAREERTLRENEVAWDAFWFRPRRLRSVSGGWHILTRCDATSRRWAS